MVLAGLTIGSWLISAEQKKITFTAPVIILLIFALWVTFTSFFAQVPESVWTYWGRAEKTFLMTFITVILVTSRERIHALVWILVLSVGVLGIRSGIPTIVSVGSHHAYGPPQSFITDNNALALVLVMTLPMIRYLYLETQNKWIRYGLLGIFTLAVFAIIGTTSRGGFLGLVAVGTALVWKSRQRVTIFFLVIVFGAALAVFVPQKWVDRMETIENYEEDASAMGRINAWTFGYRLARENPLTGGGFRPYLDSDLYMRLVPDALRPRSLHSIYFEVLADHGFVGLGIFLALLFATWKAFAKVRRLTRENPELGWANNLASMGQASLVGYMAAGAFQNLAYFDHIYTVIALSAILLVYIQKQTTEEPVSREFHDNDEKKRFTRRPSIAGRRAKSSSLSS